MRRHESRPANPDIARVFYLRGMMDQLGLGTLRLVEESRKTGARLPEWKASDDSVALTLFASPSRVKLAERQQHFLATVIQPEGFKGEFYAKFAKVSIRQARRDLAEMEGLGLIVREGAGPATLYRLS